MINKILDDIKNQQITITSWILGFVGILFVRLLLESVSSPTLYGVAYTDSFSIIHIGLYFVTVTLGTILIFGYFLKNYTNSAKYVLYGLPLIWIAPIVDIIVSKGSGLKMLYIFDNGVSLFYDFLTFFGKDYLNGATIGIRIGIAISLLGLGYLIWKENNNIKKSALGIVIIYSFVFIMASLPGILYTVTHLNIASVQNTEVISYFQELIESSTISHNTLKEGISMVSKDRFLEIGFGKILSQLLFLISILILSILFYKIDKNKFLSVMANIRLERVNFYTASLLSGIGFAYINRLGNTFVWVDVLGILSLLIAWVSLWMNAVHLNDIHDVEIDKISNKNRPLVKKELSKEEMKDVGLLWLSIGLLGAWCAGYYPFFMAIVYVCCSYIYSAPPLRLRRFPIIPSFLISVACLATILAGFFFISIYKEITVFPVFLSLGILVMVTLAINFKDIKDIDGDKASGIMTIPTLFPRNGVKIAAFLFAVSILLVPYFLSFYLLYIISIPCSYIGYKLITRKPYVEKHIFTLRFFFLGAIGLSYIVVYYFAYVYNLV